jgi:hypothetical protein
MSPIQLSIQVTHFSGRQIFQIIYCEPLDQRYSASSASKRTSWTHIQSQESVPLPLSHPLLPGAASQTQDHTYPSTVAFFSPNGNWVAFTGAHPDPITPPDPLLSRPPSTTKCRISSRPSPAHCRPACKRSPPTTVTPMWPTPCASRPPT